MKNNNLIWTCLLLLNCAVSLVDTCYAKDLQTSVGRVMRTLRKPRLSERTSVISTSDKGGYLTKMSETPDLMQTLKQARFLGGGKMFCAPVATSNALMWLGTHGYPKLLPKSQGNQAIAQIQMVHLLASREMMNTSERSGTGPRRLMHGIKQYVESCEYRCAKLLHQGWRAVPKEYRHERQAPDLKWMKSEFANDRSAVLWNIGWYQAGKQEGEYERLGGHWVTLVGYQSDKRHSSTGDVFILHDPASRAGETLSHERVFLKKLKSGNFVGQRADLPQSAQGYYLLGGDFHIKSTADYAILDGVIVLELSAGNLVDEKKHIEVRGKVGETHAVVVEGISSVRR